MMPVWLVVVVVYYCRTYEKAVSGGGEREKGGHVLRDTTSRGLCVRVWPPHTRVRVFFYIYCMFITVGPMKKL